MRSPDSASFILRRLNIVIASLVLLSAVVSSRAQTVDQHEVPPLETGQPVKRKIGGGESHYYRIALRTDQYVQIVVDQHGIDVRVKLFQPDGNVVAESNRLTGSYGPETISWVAQTAGFYKLEVRSIERSQRADFYEVKLLQERVATFQDRNRITPQNVYMQAEQLREQKTPQSLDQAIAKYEEVLQVSRDVNDAQWEAETLNVLGLIYHVLKRDSQNARQRFEKALQIRQSSGDRRGVADTLTNIARTYEAAGQNQSALDYYTRSLQPWQDAGDQYGLAWTLYNIGRVYYLSKDGPSALDYQKRALTMWKHLGDVAREAATLNAIGDTYVLINDYKSARSTYEEARTRSQAAGDGDGEVSILFSMSTVYAVLHDKQKEDEYKALAEKLERQVAAERVPTPEDQARWDKTRLAEEALADARKLLSGSNSDQRKAVERYEDAVRIFDSSAEYDREVFALFDISSAYRILKDKNKERQTLERSLSLAKRVRSNSLQAETLKRLADFYLSEADSIRAAESYDLAIELYQKTGDRSSEAYVLSSAAKVYNSLGNKEKPRTYLERALRLYRELSDRFREAYTLNDLAAISKSETNQTTLDYLKQTRALRRANRDRAGEAESLREIIAVYLSMGQKREVLDYYHQALALYIEIKDGMGAAEILRDLMVYWKEQNRPRLAIFYGKQSVNTYQEIRRNIQGLEEQTQKSFISAKEDVYRSLADLLVDEGRFPEAQQVLNMLKEEEIHNYLRDKTAKESPATDNVTPTPSEGELYAKYKAHTERATEIGNQMEKLLAKTIRSPDDIAEEERLQKKLDEANDEFYTYLKNNAKEVLDPGKSGVMIATFEGLRSTLRDLGPGSVVLYTLVLNDKYRVILFTPSVNIVRQYSIKRADLNQKIMALRLALKNADTDPLPAAQELYNILIRPIAPDLERADAKTLMWSLDRSLRYVPFSVLHDGEKYMVERYKNEVFTPASIANLAKPPNTNWRGLAFGVSNPSVGVPLPAVIDELHKIFRDEEDKNATVGLVPGKIFLNEQVKKDVFIDNIRLQQYPLVHIASHFNLNTTDELLSYLVLGNGDTISAAELRSKSTLFYKVDLLTLSACNTGVAVGEDNGVEVDSFADVTQKQGAQAVVASLWSVADPSTSALMQKFYEFRVQNSQQPMSKAAALQEAQLALLHKQVTAPDKDYAHPFYWGPFILIGNWR